MSGSNRDRNIENQCANSQCYLKNQQANQAENTDPGRAFDVRLEGFKGKQSHQNDNQVGKESGG